MQQSYLSLLERDWKPGLADPVALRSQGVSLDVSVSNLALHSEFLNLAHDQFLTTMPKARQRSTALTDQPGYPL